MSLTTVSTAASVKRLMTMSDNDTDDETNGTRTNTTDTRFAATNDLLSILLVSALIALLAHHTYAGAEIPLWLATAFVLAVLTAVVWAFGAGAFAKAADALGDR